MRTFSFCIYGQFPKVVLPPLYTWTHTHMHTHVHTHAHAPRRGRGLGRCFGCGYDRADGVSCTFASTTRFLPLGALFWGRRGSLGVAVYSRCRVCGVNGPRPSPASSRVQMLGLFLSGFSFWNFTIGGCMLGEASEDKADGWLPPSGWETKTRGCWCR